MAPRVNEISNVCHVSADCYRLCNPKRRLRASLQRPISSSLAPTSFTHKLTLQRLSRSIPALAPLRLFANFAFTSHNNINIAQLSAHHQETPLSFHRTSVPMYTSISTAADDAESSEIIGLLDLPDELLVEILRYVVVVSSEDNMIMVPTAHKQHLAHCKNKAHVSKAGSSHQLAQPAITRVCRGLRVEGTRR